MRIEHVAFNVAEPRRQAEWFVEHLGMRIVRAFDNEFLTTFLGDSAGETILELYCNPSAPVPDYTTVHPLTLHVAVLVEDVAGVRDALLAADATPEGDIVATPDGDELAMLRDPWGLAVQLMKRAEPMKA